MNDGDAHLSRRRNGRLVACNPCRSRKVACDHSRPICTRCIRRRQGNRCIYPEPEHAPGPASRRGSQIRAIDSVSPDPDELPTVSVQSQSNILSSHAGPAGFVRFATYSTVFVETQNSLSLLGVSIAEDVEAEIQARQQPQNISFKDLPLPIRESCLFVLRCLPGQSNAQIKFGNNVTLPGSWDNVAVELIVQSLQQTFHQLLNRGEEGLEAMATILCNNTARQFNIHHDNPREWLGQFCGANLRWESLGLLWANLARVSDILDTLYAQSVDWARYDHSLDTVQACLGYSIDICRFLTAGNELLLDLLRMKSTLDTIVAGVGSK